MTKGNEKESMARLKKLMTIMDSMNDQGTFLRLLSEFGIFHLCVCLYACSQLRWLDTVSLKV